MYALYWVDVYWVFKYYGSKEYLYTMNLQENIHRIKEVMGINEQKAPAKPAPQQAAAPKADNNNTAIFVEALTQAANGMLAYASQAKPGFIGVIMDSGGQSKITTKEDRYGAYVSTHSMQVIFYEVTKNPTSKEDIVTFDLVAYNEKKEYNYGVDLNFQTALQLYNQQLLTIGRSGAQQYNGLGPAQLLLTLIRMKFTIEQAVNLMKNVVPDIGVGIIANLTKSEYESQSAQEKQKYQNLITKMTPLVSGGQQPQQTQP